jgi:hypothetical protein
LSVFYDYDIIAQTGENGLTGFGNAPSINDTGNVAFVGKYADGSEAVLVGGGTGPAQIVSADLNPNFRFGNWRGSTIKT